ncbi:MAG: hypothetical protein AVDCRST_MAG40-1473, partial [uncultured Gemmatimonadaceae bacterium]
GRRGDARRGVGGRTRRRGDRPRRGGRTRLPAARARLRALRSAARARRRVLLVVRRLSARPLRPLRGGGDRARRGVLHELRERTRGL